jgi:phosphoglucosamine mutase
MRLFGTSGVRGVVGEELTNEVALELGLAVGTILPVQSSVCIATDPRLSRDMLKAGITAGILSTGINVVDLGILPTPCLAWLTQKLAFAAGIMVTASHNPPQFNGFKLWNPSTIGYSRDQEEVIEKVYFEKTYRTAEWDNLGEMSTNYAAVEAYFETVKKKIPLKTDLKIVVDPGNGAASKIATDLFKKMGVSVLPLNDEPDGTFPSRPSEPREDTLEKTIQYLKDETADLAVCFDGDADRVVFCDRQGFLGYNEMIAFISYVAAEKAFNKVVATTVETGRLLDYAVAEAGGEVVRGRVGDVAVAHLMREHTACIGVEQVGVYILPEIGMHPDSLYATLYLLNKIKDPSEIHTFIASLPTMHFAKAGIPCPNPLKEEVMKAVASEIDVLEPESTNLLDGIRLEFSDSWLLIRPSGTEPLIRVICESESESRMETFLNEGKNIVQDALEKVNS